MELLGTQEQEKGLIYITRPRGKNLDKIHVEGVSSAEIKALWPSIIGRVELALVNGNSLASPASIKNYLLENEMQLWFVGQAEKVLAVVITQIENFDTAHVLHIVALEGTGMETWLFELERVLRVFGAAHGCRYLSMQGRRGWVKTLKNLNWYESSVIMHKELL